MTGNIWVKQVGNMGNRALQYLAAAGIALHAPGANIQNISLWEWGTKDSQPEPPLRNTIRFEHSFWLDVAGLGDCLQRRVVESIILGGHPYHLENYPPRAAARRLIGPTTGGTDATGFGPHQLVCSVRGAEILHAPHPDYLLLPPAYYESLAARSGLELVFFGQIGTDPFSESLKRKFPGAQFIQGRTREYDFDTLRRSANIAPSVSTFAWLAAWLSEAERIFLPVCGIFSPVQLPQGMFLPLDQPEYEYTLFPFSKAVSPLNQPVQFALAQENLARLARPASAQELGEIYQRAKAFWPALPLCGGFDAAFYEARNPDVAAAVAGGVPSALQHYMYAGYLEGRRPLELDDKFYLAMYPEAAMALAEGRFAGPLQHYQTVGHARGYRPTP